MKDLSRRHLACRICHMDLGGPGGQYTGHGHITPVEVEVGHSRAPEVVVDNSAGVEDTHRPEAVGSHRPVVAGSHNREVEVVDTYNLGEAGSHRLLEEAVQDQTRGHNTLDARDLYRSYGDLLYDDVLHRGVISPSPGLSSSLHFLLSGRLLFVSFGFLARPSRTCGSARSPFRCGTLAASRTMRKACTLPCHGPWNRQIRRAWVKLSVPFPRLRLRKRCHPQDPPSLSPEASLPAETTEGEALLGVRCLECAEAVSSEAASQRAIYTSPASRRHFASSHQRA